jgi:predicted secreted Zn-dependent protease
MALLLAALLAAPDPAPAAFAGIEGLHVLQYDVHGRNWAAIGRSIAAQGLGRTNGLEVAAKTVWRVRWNAKSLVAGKSCRIVGVSLDYAITATLPRLVGHHLDPALRRRWRTYLRTLETHEAGHARYAYRHLADIKRAVLASDCAHVARNGRAAIDAINRWEVRYDRLTRHGAAQSRAPRIE